MTPTAGGDVGARQKSRAQRQQEAQRRRAEELKARPEPVLTLQERQRARAERQRQAPILREQRERAPGSFTPRERKERLTLSQRIAALEEAAEKGSGKKS